MKRLVSGAVVVAVATGGMVGVPAATAAAAPGAAPRVASGAASANPVPAPRHGVWFGVSVDWAHESLAAYSQRLGHRPAAAVTFAGFPMRGEEPVWLDQAVDQARGTHSMLLLTLEPWDGLRAVTRARVRRLADRLAAYNRSGVPIILRFAHEMNGSWYPWNQQPQAYRAAFRRVSSVIHARTSQTAMLWAPNYGGGYPFAGGRYQAPAGSRAAERLDTNGDGQVTGTDDPYRPYWPGRRYVDWVGMSLYHWGNAYPWGENEVPEKGKFLDLLRGTYDGIAGDELAVPDFYAEYGAGMRLPVAITETGALYAPGRGGAGQLAVKSAWWDQVFAPSHVRRLPWLKLIDWFEWRKQEPEVGGIVDWTATRGKRVRRAFVRALPTWLRYAPPR